LRFVRILLRYGRSVDERLGRRGYWGTTCSTEGKSAAAKTKLPDNQLTSAPVLNGIMPKGLAYGINKGGSPYLRFWFLLAHTKRNRRHA
jgi:hypothetical protein